MKKFKVILTGFIASLLLCIGFWYHFDVFVVSLLIFLTIYIGIYAVLDFDVDPVGFFTTLLFPSLFVTSLSVALFLFINKYISFLPILYRLGTMIIVFFGSILFATYALASSMNIFNVSRYKRLPLLQAAQTLVYLSSFVEAYIIFTLITHFFLVWYELIPLTIIVSGYLFFINNWSIKLGMLENIYFTLLGMFIIAQIVLALSLFPFISYLFAPAITLCIYIFNGILIHLNKRNVLQRAILEYIILGILLLLIIFFTSEWGVAGNVLGM